MHCDVLILGGTVVDGTGGPSRRADVAVRDRRIVSVGDLSSATADQVIDATNRCVAPGFIDVHTHDDRAVLATPDMRAKVSQGVTTVVTGNCGISLAPLEGIEPTPPLNLIGKADDFYPSFRRYFEQLAETPPAVNVAAQIGHTTLRRAVMDDLGRAATPAEVDAMVRLLEAAMTDGCIGMSTGLAYPPANAAPTDEVVALASVLAKFGGIHTTHMRDEKSHVVDSVQETIDIGKRAGVPVVISHHKCSGRENWGKSEDTLALIAKAQTSQEINLDVYPYAASSTVLLTDFVRSADRVLVTWSEAEPAQNGRDLADIQAEWQCDADTAIERLQPAGAIYFQMDEGDLERIVRFPGAMIGSDGLPHDAVPHPRLWGTFPRVLGLFCRERGWLSLEEAVWRMSGKSASVFGLTDRGVIEEGAAADIVIFDPDTVIDEATYHAPEAPSTGIEHVLVNGECVWTNGSTTGARPGIALQRHAS